MPKKALKKPSRKKVDKEFKTQLPVHLTNAEHTRGSDRKQKEELEKQILLGLKPATQDAEWKNRDDVTYSYL